MCYLSKSLLQLELERNKILTERGNLVWKDSEVVWEVNPEGRLVMEHKKSEDMIEQEAINQINAIRVKLDKKHTERKARHTSAPFKDDLYRNAFINRTVDLEEILDTLTAAMLKMMEYNDI